MLVAARTAQGIGAALLVPQVLSLLQITFTGEARRRALSAYGLVLAVGVAAGQVLGGILVSADLFGTGWRPVFIVNVPAGLAVLAWSARRLPIGPVTAPARLDLAGAGWLAVGVLALVIPLTFGADAGWPAWSWPSLAASAVVLAAFARHEHRLTGAGRDPLIDPALLARSGIRTGLAGVFILHASYGGLLFTTAVYLQHALHQSPLQSGLTFAGYAAGFAGASVTWTRLPAAWRPRLPLAAFAGFAAATGLLAWLTSTGGWPWQASAVLVIDGAAHGTGFDALVHRNSADLPASCAAAFSGVLATIGQLAIVAGIAVAGTIYLAGPIVALPPMTVVLIALASAVAAAGTGVSVALARERHRQHPGLVPGPAARGCGRAGLSGTGGSNRAVSQMPNVAFRHSGPTARRSLSAEARWSAMASDPRTDGSGERGADVGGG